MSAAGIVVDDSGVARCWWAAGTDDYVAYHDHEWGVAVHGETRLYERLTLEAFQSGLSWLTILRKREGFRAAFARFDAEGTVFGSIGKKDFRAIPCVMPPREVVLAYEMNASLLEDRVDVNERGNRNLAALRGTLLPKLMAGELPVRKPEQFVEAAE